MLNWRNFKRFWTLFYFLHGTKGNISLSERNKIQTAKIYYYRQWNINIFKYLSFYYSGSMKDILKSNVIGRSSFVSQIIICHVAYQMTHLWFQKSIAIIKFPYLQWFKNFERQKLTDSFYVNSCPWVHQYWLVVTNWMCSVAHESPTWWYSHDFDTVLIYKR